MTEKETTSAITIDAQALGTAMIDAARATFGRRGPALQAATTMELQRLAGTLADIQGMLATGQIDQEQARTMANIYRLAVRSVLRSVEGLGLLAADQILQAVVGVAATTLNRVVGFKLL